MATKNIDWNKVNEWDISEEERKRINILRSFCENDSYHVNRAEPYRVGKIVFATDGYSAIAMNEDLVISLRDELQIFDKFGLPIPVEPSDTNITLKDLQEFINGVKKTFKNGAEIKMACRECDGSGEVEWEYTDCDGETHFENFRCPICKGKGFTSERQDSVGINSKNLSNEFYTYVEDEYCVKLYHIIQLKNLMQKLGFETGNIRPVTNNRNLFCVAFPNGIWFFAIKLSHYTIEKEKMLLNLLLKIKRKED